METDRPTRPDRGVKTEEDSHDNRIMPDSKPSYRSWKKKYRKMRVIFDRKMQDGEALYKLEQKALETTKRLAVENDRLLDLLLDNNNCPQIPPDKRIDLSLPESEGALSLNIDHTTPPSTPKRNGMKSYRQLLSEVPHFGFASAAGRLPDLVLRDLNTGCDSPADPQQGNPHPPTFLTADDIDNYLYEIDVRLAAQQRARSESPPDLLPTLAPLAGTNGQPPSKAVEPATLLANLHSATSHSHNPGHAHHPASSAALPASSSAARDLAVRNPTSVYNWLRKHAPKTFLQDHEVSAADHHAGGASEEPAHGGHAGLVHAGASGRGGGGRGARGGAHAERGDRGPIRGSARAKKTGGASGRAVKGRDAEAMDLDDDGGFEFTTPSEGKKGAGKRKRVVDDDPGYRPKGGSSRPAKKKRKSAGADTGTPTPAAKEGGAKDGWEEPRRRTLLYQATVEDGDEEGEGDITARDGDN